MFKIVIGLVFSIGGLYLAFRDIDLTVLGDLFAGASTGWIFLAVLLMLFSVWVRAVRWQALIEPIRNVSMKPLFLLP